MDSKSSIPLRQAAEVKVTPDDGVFGSLDADKPEVLYGRETSPDTLAWQKDSEIESSIVPITKHSLMDYLKPKPNRRRY